MKKILAVLVMAILPIIAGCGGGNGDNDSTFKPTTAVLKFSSQGAPNAGKAVKGFSATIELPAGVTVKTGTDGTVDAAVVVPSGLMGGSAGTVGPVIYTPVTTSAKARLDFSLLSMAPAGVNVGEYATITLSLTGVSPAVTDFVVTSFKPVDLNFANLAGLTPLLNLSVY